MARRIDQECISLCRTINRLKNIKTISSCCGHGRNVFRIFIRLKNSNTENLPILLYYLDPCHMGFGWNCKVKTDCAMSPVTFYIESKCKGKKAYKEAEEISLALNRFLDTRKENTIYQPIKNK